MRRLDYLTVDHRCVIVPVTSLFSLFAVVSRFNTLIFISLNRFFPLLVRQCLYVSDIGIFYVSTIFFDFLPLAFMLFYTLWFFQPRLHFAILIPFFRYSIWCCAVLVTGCTGWMLRVEFRGHSLEEHANWTCRKPSPDLLLEFVNVSEENKHWFTSLLTWKRTVGWGYLFTCLTFFLVSACTCCFPRSKMTND